MPDSGHFTAEGGADAERPGTVLLTARDDDWVVTLNSMCQDLEQAGYTCEESPHEDAVFVRWATPKERADRTAQARQRTARLLAVILPDLPPDSDAPPTLFSRITAAQEPLTALRQGS